MIQGRATHGCAVFELQGQKILIVSGGYSSTSAWEDYDHVEFLNLETKTEWIEGI